MLLASGVSSAARAQSAATTQLDATALIYGEQNRANVVEPQARITRLFANGQSLSAQLGFDAITGASPSGAMPSGRIQTTTTPSGNVQTTSGNEVPTSQFKDNRIALDGEWVAPIANTVTPTFGAHFSREKDYQSVGGSAKLAVDLFHHRTTLTAGAGLNKDNVFPVGGTPAGLTDGTVIVSHSWNPKDVRTNMVGFTQVLTRRWLMGVSVSNASEDGYLTEPYKVISVVEPDSGHTVGQLTENRPATRKRASVMLTSVNHLATDIIHSSYRYYSDDWGIRSHTLDFKYRHDLDVGTFLEPHVRFYDQSQADFFVPAGFAEGAPLPKYASSDYRLGPLRTVTLGGLFGFRIPNSPGEWSVRAEYILQTGNGHPDEAIGVQKDFDLYPAVNIGTLTVGYSIQF